MEKKEILEIRNKEEVLSDNVKSLVKQITHLSNRINKLENETLYAVKSICNRLLDLEAQNQICVAENTIKFKEPTNCGNPLCQICNEDEE